MISEPERSVEQKGIPVMIKLGQCLKKKNLEFQLVLWTSSSYILLALVMI